MIAILTYHSLDDSGSVLSVPPGRFTEQMRVLSGLGVRVIPLDQVRHELEGPRSSEPLVVITFDDGFRSVYEDALPVLQRYGFPATVFLVTDYCGRTNAWPSQPLAVARRPLLTWAEVREMSGAGITFGSHTRTHPDLRTLPSSGVEEELVISKKAIEDAIGRPVDTFAYPYGAYDDTIRHLAEEHFALACSTTLGFVRPVSDPFALPRLDMYYLRHPLVFRRLFSKELDLYIRLRGRLRRLRGQAPGRIVDRCA